jgi:antitoxin (DNA-binding transcriptional repressor) of toxin-antitoxin stability system|tara:strand:+ start:3495 stop:3719 length:225 start_codon:yes stop_codon:yes gene_type:complete
MEMSVPRFKATCLAVIEKVQREKCHVVISRHGKPAAELSPVIGGEAGSLFGRSSKTTLIKGDLNSTEETWDAED